MRDIIKVTDSAPEKFEFGKWNITDKYMHQIKPGEEWDIRSVNFSPNGRYFILTHSLIPVIKVIDLETLEVYRLFDFNEDSVRLTIFPDGINDWFLAVSWDGTIRRVNLESGRFDMIAEGLPRMPATSYINRNGRELVFTISYDKEHNPFSGNCGRAWLMSDYSLVAEYPHGKRQSLSAPCGDILPDPILDCVFTGSDDGQIIKWSTDGTMLMNYALPEPRGGVRKMAISKKWLVAALSNSHVAVFNKHKPGPVFYYRGMEQDRSAEILDVRISADEKAVFSCNGRGIISKKDLVTGKTIYASHYFDWSWSCKILPGDQLLAVSYENDGLVDFVDTGDLSLKCRFYNYPGKDLMFEVPPNALYKNGFFYTNNPEKVKIVDRADSAKEVPAQQMVAYFNMLNLKSAVVLLLKNRHALERVMAGLGRSRSMLGDPRNIKLLGGPTDQEPKDEK